MKKIRYSLLCLTLCIPLFISAKIKSTIPEKSTLTQATTFTVLQFNIWQAGAKVTDGFDKIVSTILQLKPDLIALSEVSNHDGVNFMNKLQHHLEEKGVNYYTDSSDNVGILSRYPIHIFKNYSNDFVKAVIDIHGIPLAFYSLHIDYTQYAEYLPRGYDVTTYQKSKEGSIIDSKKVLTINDRSKRDEQVKAFLKAASADRREGRQVIVAGDFNEASFLDWTEKTKHLWEHNGAVIPWTCSKMLYNNGFKDSYRVVYPNVRKHPGFTWVVNTPWIDADERDRIDFIYYYAKSHKIHPIHSAIVGPQKIYINKTKTVSNQSEDLIVIPQKDWVSDHRAVLTTFKIKE